MKDLFDSQAKLLQIYGQRTLHAGEYDRHIYAVRQNLIEEEHGELQMAIINLAFECKDNSPLIGEARAHFLKEFSDLLVVLFGTAAQLGFTESELSTAFDMVDLDNQSKAYANEASAKAALEFYKAKDPNHYIEQITIGQPPVQITAYIVKNPAGKVMKRYPQPETSVETRIQRYCLAERNRID